jgi:hypothetical protein
MIPLRLGRSKRSVEAPETFSCVLHNGLGSRWRANKYYLSTKMRVLNSRACEELTSLFFPQFFSLGLFEMLLSLSNFIAFAQGVESLLEGQPLSHRLTKVMVQAYCNQ